MPSYVMPSGVVVETDEVSAAVIGAVPVTAAPSGDGESPRRRGRPRKVEADPLENV